MTMTTAIAVCIDGPSSRLNDDLDEVPEWLVYVIDANGDEVGTVWYCDTYHAAVNLGCKIAYDRHLELNNEASPE